MRRLNSSSTNLLSPQVKVSDYSRASAPRVVHLGAGGFFRSHVASYFEDLNATSNDPWMIVAASLQTRTIADVLNQQDGLFVHVAKSHDGDAIRLIRSVNRILPPVAENKDLIDLLSSAETTLVTLTITEKGYGLNPSTGSLDTNNVLIAHDLNSLEAPVTPVGVIAAALMRRFKVGLAPLVILPCDNITQNGAKARAAMIQMASAQSRELGRWVERDVVFSSTMVDRITPAAREDQVQSLASKVGLLDKASVFTEPYCQWVIQDNCRDRLPAMASVGVQWASDVSVWETLKLCMLNAAHSAMAYAGGLAGYQYVHEVMKDEPFGNLVRTLWAENSMIIKIDQAELSQYLGSLENRFRNDALPHALHQIAMDGSHKLPQRILSAIEVRLHRGLEVKASSFVVAAWILWQCGIDDNGRTFTVHDPLTGKIQAIIGASQGTDSFVQGLLGLPEIFGDLPSKFPGWAREVTELVNGLMDHGARVSVHQLFVTQVGWQAR